MNLPLSSRALITAMETATCADELVWQPTAMREEGYPSEFRATHCGQQVRLRMEHPMRPQWKADVLDADGEWSSLGNAMTLHDDAYSQLRREVRDLGKAISRRSEPTEPRRSWRERMAAWTYQREARMPGTQAGIGAALLSGAR